MKQLHLLFCQAKSNWYFVTEKVSKMLKSSRITYLDLFIYLDNTVCVLIIHNIRLGTKIAEDHGCVFRFFLHPHYSNFVFVLYLKMSLGLAKRQFQFF